MNTKPLLKDDRPMLKRHLFLLLIALVPGVWADTAFDAPGNLNPIVPGYFADPTIERFGDTFYLYATTDGNGGGRGPATVWVSRDFVNWTLVPMNWPTTPHYWAPDVVEGKDGRYTLYYNQPCITYGGASDSPIGPWTPLTPGEGVVIPDRLVKDVITLDTQVFEDRDGSLYTYWGTWGIYANSGCGVGRLNSDMKSFSKLGMIPNTQARDFFEAPFMIERNGAYYFTYSSGSCHDQTYRVQYAVGTRPDGEFRMGSNNPILSTTPDGLIHGPGHHSILQLGNDYFIVYHRHDIPVTPNGMHRQTCADRLIFEGDGAIKKVEPTHRGVGPLDPSPSPSTNVAFGKRVTASSFYRDTLRRHDFRPEYALDDNNATLWRPADNRMGHWLVVDLGGEQSVRRTLTQFEYATWYYQYLIEHSLDGRTWQVFADRRQNTRWGSPMVDTGDVRARYLRITVTGVEYPGLFGALWGFKAFADAPDDPLQAMADKAFDQWIRPTQRPAPMQQESKGLLVHLDVADLQLGAPVASWKNLGALGGGFKTGDARPVVGMAAGRKAVRFSGKEVLTASFPAPRSLAGNSAFTVAAWVNNPQIGESECIVSWAGRGGPDATTAQVGYGTQGQWGAVGHWGFADMGFRGGPPKAGQWHHLAVVFDGVIERIYVDGQLNAAAAKMLMMHEGRPVYVGASEPGTEPLDGYLASLRIYDTALGEAEVRGLAAQEPVAEVLVHVDSARLDYGPLGSWPNSGSLGGVLIPRGDPPKVGDVAGRIAVQFGQGRSLEWTADSEVSLGDFTLLAGAVNPSPEPGGCAVELLGADGTPIAILAGMQAGGWQQVAIVYQGGEGTFFADGVPTTRRVPPPPKGLKGLRLSGDRPFTGALSRVQLFRRALSVDEISQLHAVWTKEWQSPAPNPAAFAQAPAALCPTVVGMTAQPGQSKAGGIEYLFTETTGRPGGTGSGWTPVPFFIDDGLDPDGRYAYTVKVRDALGNVTDASEPVEAATDAQQFEEVVDGFASDRDYLVNGTAGTIWDGLIGRGEGSAAEVIAAREGVLRLQSKATVWDGGSPRGPFLYNLVKGDFVVQVRVADYAGLTARRPVGNNDGGLMVRVPKIEDAGPGEDLVQLTFFPPWNQGNMVTSLDGGSRPQRGNRLGFDAYRHLQILKQGPLFVFRASPDGTAWVDLPGSPVERRDMAGLPVQVGLCHASYGQESSSIAFHDFHLWVRRTGDTP